jgi:ABC-2 type transport system permease protein
MFEAFLSACKEECRQIQHSWYKLGLISFLPIICFALLIAIFHQGVARELPVAVVDYDKSQLSRDFRFALNASPTAKIAYVNNDVKSALKLLQSAKVYGVVIIPKNFMRETTLQKSPQVTLMLNTQYILIAKTLKAALLQSSAEFAAKVEASWQLRDVVPQEVKNQVMPIELYNVPFFNNYKNYFYFLVSALLPAMWQIFIVIATIVSFGSLFKANKEKLFFGKRHIEAKIFGKLFPYTIAYFFLGAAYLFYIYGVESWPFNGSMALMLFTLFLTVLAYEAVALFLFVSSFNYARALSLGAVYTAPAFAFLGITFPIYAMNGFALFWRDMLPISSFVEIQIALANYGADFIDIEEKIVHILLFLPLFVLVFFAFRRRLLS